VKQQIADLVYQALISLQAQNKYTLEFDNNIQIERTRDPKHGDFACNIAMQLAKTAKTNPRELAQAIIEHLPASDYLRTCDIAGPGFINFALAADAQYLVLNKIFKQAETFGTSQTGVGEKIMLEFVSANPTGPLHVGHGRGAAYGAVVANLLRAVGYQVHCEYYVNDAGRQMNILAASVWLRYLEACGESFDFPSNGYKGEYIRSIADELRQQHDDELRHSADSVFANLPADLSATNPEGDKEAHIDAIIERAQTLLGHKNYHVVFGAGLNSILQDIRDDLAEFGVVFDEWFSERSLMDKGAVQHALNVLKKNDAVYEQNGALWFRSTSYGDEKDRVVVRENGQTTYFASDIAYHLNKFERGFDKAVDIWGADHHGYVPRVKASLQAMGANAAALDVLMVQFAVLYRQGEKVQMSTRSGEFVTLRELREDVGNDAARFFYIMRKCEQHLDFDLDLAKSKSNENPVYYIQYAHARICSVFKEAQEKNMSLDAAIAKQHLSKLDNSHEHALLKTLSRFPEVVEAAALNYEPHQIPHYLRELANDFHTYYNAHKFLIDDNELRHARLYLILACQQVIQNGLRLIGVSAPEAM